MGSNDSRFKEIVKTIIAMITLGITIVFICIFSIMVWPCIYEFEFEKDLKQIQANQNQIILLLSAEYPCHEELYPEKKRKPKMEKSE